MSGAGQSLEKLTELDESSREQRDVFRERPLRYLGYANEIGEAFRHMVPVRWVHFSYVIASGYVMTHSIQQGLRAKQNAHNSSPSHTHTLTPHTPHIHQTRPSAAVLDTLVWQGLASVIIPGFTINRICALTRYLLQGPLPLSSPLLKKWAVTIVGLGAIPFIITPIDRSVDKCMDVLSRPLLKKFYS